MKYNSEFSRHPTGAHDTNSWCRACIRRHYRKMRTKSPAASLVAAARRRVGPENVTITKEWVQAKIDKGVCEATGIPLVMTESLRKQDAKNTVRNPYAPSLDRIDSRNRSYSPSNTQVVLWAYNRAKGEWPKEVILEVAKALIDRINQTEETDGSSETETDGQIEIPLERIA